MIQFMIQLAQIGVIAAWIMYIYKRCVVPALWHQYEHDAHNRKQLSEQGDMLREKAMELASIISQEEQKIYQLQQRIEQWQEVIKHEDEKESATRTIQHQDALQKRLDYASVYQETEHDMHLGKEAIAQAHTALQDYFAHSSHGQEYNRCITRTMHENKQ